MLARKLVLITLKLYQATWFARRQKCRFYPTCSSYASQGIEKHGLLKGLLLTFFRLIRCHPFHKGGIDEVPQDFHLTR